jgi:hypothetical protein
MSRRRALVAIGVAAALGASLLVSGPASAHNISIRAAAQKADARAQQVMNATIAIEADRSCKAAFQGHNHYARCTLRYDSAATRQTKRYWCSETLDVYLLPEDTTVHLTNTIFTRHLTRSCWGPRLTGPRP